MSNATLEKPGSGMTPFALLWGQEAPEEAYSESEWFFSEDTQGFSSISASSQDKERLTPPRNPNDDGGDFTCTFG